MKAKGEIEALKTLTDFRNKPLAMLRGQGSAWALRSPALAPGCPAEGWQRARPTHEGKRFGGTWTLWPSRGRETETPQCPWWSLRDVPGVGGQHGAGMILCAARRATAPSPARAPGTSSTHSGVSSSLCKRESLQLGTDGGCAPGSLGICCGTVQNRSRCRYTFSPITL